MANNNDQLFNAALAGFVSGYASSRNPGAPITTAIKNAAVAFATQVDSKIPTDGLLISPTTAYTTARTQLLMNLCEGAAGGSVQQSTTALDYDGEATVIAASYAAMAAVLA